MLQRLQFEEGREFRDFLQEAGYTMAALTRRFSSPEIPQLHLLKLFSHGIPLEPSSLSVLFRWFWIGMPVETSAAAQWIPERTLNLFLKAGVLVQDGNFLRGTVRISPFERYLVASDHAIVKPDRDGFNTILWPNPTTLLCYHLCLRSRVSRTLDFGTGNGVLALSAAQHSDHVVATDLNPRAAEFCDFNAALNGVSNVEFRQGDAFEPVAGEKFDLILANPPFFVTPSVRRLYSDNTMELDGFCRMVANRAAQHLTEGGYAQMLAEWVTVKGQAWHERLTEWFAGIGCDASVIAMYSRSAETYAMLRIFEDRDHLSTAQAQAERIIEWQNYFDERGVQSIHGGIIVLRKRSGRNWIHLEETHSVPSRPFGDFLRRIFENRDALDNCASDEQLLALRPALPASARLRSQSELSPEGWKSISLELDGKDGVSSAIPLQPQVTNFLALCNGQRTLLDCADQFAADIKFDPAVVRRECCAIIRRLAERNAIIL